jgi:endonuclease/exonuclease/phosphatase family metal-dependent hydrolase
VACLLVVVAATGWWPVGSPPGPSRASGGGRTAASPAPPEQVVAAPTRGSRAATYTVMQLNLCLSGFAGCYDPATYPATVEEAVARIAELRPDAVTVTEACRRDAVTMAERLGYDVRFARVRYAGAPLPCVDPGGRGLFGNAVLTRAAIVGVESERFDAQADLEERRWLCAKTRDDVAVCTAHLETPHTRAARAARDIQCTELAEVLALRSSDVFVFGGDVNRRTACAPSTAWRRTDSAADRAPGIQRVYGSAALRRPRSAVLPAELSDHDILVVHATLAPR